MLLLGINGAVLLILDVVLDGALPFVLSGLAVALLRPGLVRLPDDRPGAGHRRS